MKHWTRKLDVGEWAVIVAILAAIAMTVYAAVVPDG